MEFLSNEGINALGDKLRASLSSGDKLSIISSYFTVFAFGELKDELTQVDELRFLFDEPTFVEQMAELKDPKEFVLSKRGRERGIGGTGLELTLRNNLNQRALAHECAEWVRAKASFRSARSRGVVQSGSVYHVLHADGTADGFQGFNLPFTLEGLGYERKAGVVSGYGSYSGAAEADGISSITAVCRLAQQRFGEWSELPDELRTTESFVVSVNADYFKLLDILTIARSRKHIAKFYRDETATFPTRLKPISLHPRFDTQDELTTTSTGTRCALSSGSDASTAWAPTTAACSWSTSGPTSSWTSTGEYPRCKDADTYKLTRLLSELRELESSISVLRKHYRDKSASIAQTSRLRMELRNAEREHDKLAAEIKELCHG